MIISDVKFCGSGFLASYNSMVWFNGPSRFLKSDFRAAKIQSRRQRNKILIKNIHYSHYNDDNTGISPHCVSDWLRFHLQPEHHACRRYFRPAFPSPGGGGG